MAIRAQRTHAPPWVMRMFTEWGSTAAAVLVPLSLYLSTATRTVQGGDTGEFAAIGAHGGVAHPPGYPLYTALARLLCLLPLPDATWLSPPAFRVAMLSALLGALAAGVLERALRRATGSRLGALGGALALALSPLMWRLSGVPEVFTGNALAAAATLLFCLRLQQAAPEQARKEAALLGVVLGLGAANHHTIVLCAPIVIQALLACALRPGWPSLRTLGALGAGAALGLLAYLYLPLAAALAGTARFSWGDLDTPAGVLRHIARAQYGTFQLSLGGSAAPLTQIERYLAALPREFLYLHAALGVFGFGAALHRARWQGLAILCTFLLCGVLFPALINLPLSGVGPATAARFHLLPNLWFAVAIGFGLAEAARRLPRPAAGAIVLLPLAASALLNRDQGVNWRADPTIERFLQAGIQGAAPRAVILGRGDLYGFGYRYVRDGLGLRPDVRYLDVHLLRLRWYHERARREVPELQLPFDPETTYVRLAAERLAARVPTYVTADLAPLLPGLAIYPEGMLARIAPPGSKRPPPAELEPGIRRATEPLLSLPPPVDIWSAQIREVAAMQWKILARAYDHGGDRARGDACRAVGEQLTRGVK